MNPYELTRPRPSAAAKARPPKRIYGAADYTRLTADWAPTSSSEDAELVTSLRLLRNRSRQLIRDNEYAKNAKRQVVQNVIGTGVGLQATVKNQRDKLIEDLNSNIQEVWHDWWKTPGSVHTAGLMSGPDIERYIMSNAFESGEAFIQIVRRPFGESKIPLALELIESDRVMDQWTQQTAPNGNLIRMGVEMDQWHRPLAYWLWPVHPGDWQFSTFAPSNFIRAPAADIFHIYSIERWPQSRGIPWLHSAMKRLNNMGGYEEAEIIAARAAAAMMGFIESPEAPETEDVVDNKQVLDFEPGQVRHLLPGEQFKGWNPARPNTALEAFIRQMLRAIASGVGMSYETLSRDYSQTNYSSARAAQLEDRDLWRVLQTWFITAFRQRLHREFMFAAVLAGQISIPDYLINETKYNRAHFKPRGWTWIDPTKEVAAYNIGVRSGFMTVGDVIEQTGAGRDANDVFKARRQELDQMAELDLIFDTDPAQVNQKGIAQPNTAPDEEVDKPVDAGEQATEGGADDDSKPAPSSTAPTAKPKSGSKAVVVSMLDVRGFVNECIARDAHDDRKKSA